MKFSKNMHKDDVYVFGTSLSGRHDFNSIARKAIRYGARSGRGVGISGMTYAIPVRGFNNEILSYELVEQYIDRFVKFSRDYPQIKFFINRISGNRGEHTDKRIAPLFRYCGDNCILPDEWKPFFENL